MKILICYDVADDKRRRRLVKYLEKIAIRIQYSVFLADITERQIKQMNEYAEKILDKEENDKFYYFNAANTDSWRKADTLPKEFMII